MGTAFSGVILIALFVQLVKSYLEAFGLAPAAKLHDPIIWTVAFGSGIAGYVADTAIHNTLTWTSGEDAAGRGLLAAFSALGAYHLVTHPYWDTPPTTATATLATGSSAGGVFLFPAAGASTVAIPPIAPEPPPAA